MFFLKGKRAPKRDADKSTRTFLRAAANEESSKSRVRDKREDFRLALQVLLRTGKDVFSDTAEWSPHAVAAFRDFESAARHLAAEMNATSRTVPLDWVEFDPRDCVQDACAPHRESATDKGLSFFLRITSEMPARVSGDVARLRRIVDGFLARSIAHTKTGTVRCEVTHIEETGKLPHRVMIRIRDTGAGFDYGATKALFESDDKESATRLDDKPGMREMRALKSIVDEMGGELSVFSQKTFGTTVTINLWFGAARGASIATLSRDINLVACPVLLVDTPGESRDVFATQLKTLGVHLNVADDGVAALQKVLRAEKRGAPYEMVIIDLNVEHLSGLEVARYLKKRELSNDLCLVAITGQGKPGDGEQCKQARFSAYLARPLPPEHVGNLLKASLATMMLPENERESRSLITRHHAREFEKKEGQIVYFGADGSLGEGKESGSDIPVKVVSTLDRVIAEITRSATRLIVVDRHVDDRHMTPNSIRRGLEIIKRALGSEDVPPVVLVGEFAAAERVAFRKAGIHGFKKTVTEALAGAAG